MASKNNPKTNLQKDLEKQFTVQLQKVQQQAAQQGYSLSYLQGRFYLHPTGHPEQTKIYAKAPGDNPLRYVEALLSPETAA